MKISQTISETLSFDIPTIKNVDAPFSIGQESRIILEYARAAKLKSYIPASPPPNFKLKLDTHTQVSLQKKGGSSTPCPPPGSAPESMELCGTTWGQIVMKRG